VTACTRRHFLGLLAAGLAAPVWRSSGAVGAERVLAVGPGALRLLTYLGAAERLVGLEDIERRPLSTSSYRYALPPGLTDLPSIGPGGPGRLPDLEQLVALRPDLVVTVTLDDQQIQALRERAGLRVLPLSYGGPGLLRIDDLLTSLHTLAAALGLEARAEQLAGFLTANLAELRERLANESPATAYVGGVSLQGAHGLTSTQSGHPPLVWAGADNLADRAGPAGHLFIDREQILLWDPPVLFIDGGGLAGILAEYARESGFYQGLRAVREGRVYLTLPFNAYNTNVENALANAWMMARVLHPAALADLDVQARASAILRTFLGADILPDLARQGLGLGRLDLETGQWTPVS